jgi:hypothetical protein
MSENGWRAFLDAVRVAAWPDGAPDPPDAGTDAR